MRLALAARRASTSVTRAHERKPRGGSGPRPNAPVRGARDRRVRDRGGYPLQRGPRGRLARPGRAGDGAGGSLRDPHHRRGGRADQDGRSGDRLRPCPRTGQPANLSEHVEKLRALLDELPDELKRQAFSHSSWVQDRSTSYERLAFLGDSVLSLAVSTSLFPRFERHSAGRLTKIRAQAVSRRSCVDVARSLEVP